ncbi:MAG: glycosyltransferase, partial [Cyanobacteria bacterium J06558_2]
IKLIKFYNAADVLVAPSLYEGFGLTILEAMSCGTPTITSNVSALPEVAGDAAILVDPNDVSAITQAVLQITQDAALRQILFDKGLARVKQFSWKETAKQTAAVYEQVAKLKNKVLA